MTKTKDTSNTLSDKQLYILSYIATANDPTAEDWIDIDQLIERLPYDVTKQALQFSLRFLIKRGLIIKAGREKRRGASRITYKIEPSGADILTWHTWRIEERRLQLAVKRALRVYKTF